MLYKNASIALAFAGCLTLWGCKGDPAEMDLLVAMETATNAFKRAKNQDECNLATNDYLEQVNKLKKKYNGSKYLDGASVFVSGGDFGASSMSKEFLEAKDELKEASINCPRQTKTWDDYLAILAAEQALLAAKKDNRGMRSGNIGTDESGPPVSATTGVDGFNRYT